MTTSTTKQPKCYICSGTGFSAPGQICVCITGKNTGPLPDPPEGFAEIFGMGFGKPVDEK
jgi:hypothetical protein